VPADELAGGTGETKETVAVPVELQMQRLAVMIVVADDTRKAALADDKGTSKAKARGTAGAAGRGKAKPKGTAGAAAADQQQTVTDAHNRSQLHMASKVLRHAAFLRAEHGRFHPGYAARAGAGAGARALNRSRINSSSSNRSPDGDLSSSSSRSSSRAAAALARERRREAAAAAAGAESLDGVWAPTPKQTPNLRLLRPKSPQQAPRAKVQPDLVQPEPTQSQSQQDPLHPVLYSSSNSII
jgi:hypothetical protein